MQTASFQSPSSPPFLQGLSSSLRSIRRLVVISAATLVSSARGTLSPEMSNERIRWWVSDLVKGLRLDVRVQGHEHYEAPGPFIVMSNHQGDYDIPVLFYAVGPDLRMVTKKELFRVPLWGPAMKRVGFVEIDRSDRASAIASLNEARTKLASGTRIWIAPEGTRSRSGELLPFKKGGFVLARDTGLRILPVGISGTREVMPPGKFLSSPGKRIGVVIGPPLSTEGKSREALMAETRTAIEALVREADKLRQND